MKTFLDKFNYAIKQPFAFTEKSTDTQWDYKIQDNTLILKFEYTKGDIDWWYNFKIFHKKIRPYSGMKNYFRVHKGFVLKYKSIQARIHQIFTENNITNIEIYGFSQGAALALLAHEDIWFKYNDLRENITTIVFGCPRLFSWRAPKERWSQVLRINNSNDIVTKVPFTIFGYKHVGNQLNTGEKRVWWKLSIKDHFPKGYRKNLLNLL